MVHTAVANPANGRHWYSSRPFRALFAYLAKAARSGALAKVINGYFAVQSLAVAGLVFWLLTHVMPDGGSTDRIVYFFTHNHTAVTTVLLLLPVVLIMLVVASGAVAAKLYNADTSPGHRLSWIGFASDLGFIVIFSMEIGIVAAANLLAGRIDGQIVHALHVVACSSAFVLGGLWIPFLVSFLIISRRARLFPTWINVLALSTIATNGCAWCVALALTGPLNGQNGLIGLGLPTVGPATLFFMLLAQIIGHDLSAGVIRIHHRLAGQSEPEPQ